MRISKVISKIKTSFFCCFFLPPSHVDLVDADVSKNIMATGGELCKIVATVPTGLEKGAADECREALGRGSVVADRGRISFPLFCLDELSKVIGLGLFLSDELKAVLSPPWLLKLAG